MTNEKTVREPLFHISKRGTVTNKKIALIYISATFIALLFCGLICTVLFGSNPIEVLEEMFNGNFGTERRFWILLQDGALLLLVSLSLAPAFKMKFWNLGGNGQILMATLACVACMFYLGGKLPDVLVYLFMIIAAVGAGIIWAIIPALFKAKWNTNESLFTLMMNYIAAGLVNYAISKWSKNQTGTLEPINEANFPEIGNKYVLTILVAVAAAVFIYFYLKKSKHGFEVALVGESQNTAKYVGINVRKVVMRTLVLSGAICGLVGLLLGGAINHKVSDSAANNMGFTAIMAVWFAKCDPLIMVISSFGIIFLSRGIRHVQSNVLHLTNNAISDMIVGFVYFIIICCEFFVVYRVQIKTRKKSNGFTDINQMLGTDNEKHKTEKGDK